MKRVAILGLAGLGNWRGYRLVAYRVYVPTLSIHGCMELAAEVRKRETVVVAAKLGITAILSALYEAVSRLPVYPGKVVLSFVAPLSLLTLLDNYDEILDKLSKNSDWCKAFAHSVLKELSSQLSCFKCDGEERGVDELLKQYVMSSGRGGRKERVLLVKGLECGKDNSPASIKLDVCGRRASADGNEPSLPCVACTSTECRLTISVFEGVSGGEAEHGKHVKVPLHICVIVVPVTMASRPQSKNGKLILFREKSEDDILSWSMAFEAAVAQGLYRAALCISERLMHLHNESNDVLLAVDTTHGFNTVVAALAKLYYIYALTLHARQVSAAASNMPPAFVLLRYNSDPLPIQPTGKKPDDCGFLAATLAHNMSYYYMHDELKVLYGEIREGVDRILGLYQALEQKRDKSEVIQRLRRLLPLYLAKLGMIHWSIASILASEAPSAKDLNEGLKEPLRVRVKSKDNVYSVEYDVVSVTTLADTLTEIYYDIVSHYLKAVYEKLLKFKMRKGGDIDDISSLCFDGMQSNASTLLCIDLAKLHALLDPSRLHEGYAINSLAEPLLYLIEPGMRSILIAELEDWTENFTKRIGYFYPRAFAAKENIKCEELVANEAPLEPQDGDDKKKIKLYCVTPSSRINPTPKAIRNFIAHGGFTRLTKSIGILYTSGEGKCKPVALCIAKPLDKYNDILKAFWEATLPGF